MATVHLPRIACALAAVAGAILLPRSKDPDEQPLDLPGAGLSVVALGALVYAIIEAPHYGWLSGQTLATFALAFVAPKLMGLQL